MPEYTLASLLALGGSLAMAAWAGVLRGRAAWFGLLTFGLVTLVADLLLTGLPIVTYDRAANSGIAIGPMPIEDLFYGLALYLVAIAAWGRRPSQQPMQQPTRLPAERHPRRSTRRSG